MESSQKHFASQNNIAPPFPSHLQKALFGLGCFWGAEKKFWEQTGVFCTAAGYAGGETVNPSYESICTGLTGHAEVVSVVFDPNIILYQELLIVFWQSHNPTQWMRQGNDVGTQYRSGIYTYSSEQKQEAEESKKQYQKKIFAAGFNEITTEILDAPEFYYAEDYHQQYLVKNPKGYCGLGGLGVLFEK